MILPLPVDEFIRPRENRPGSFDKKHESENEADFHPSVFIRLFALYTYFVLNPRENRFSR